MSTQKMQYEVAATFQVAFGKGNQVTGYVRDPENPDPLVHPTKPYWFSRDTLPFLLNWWELGQGEFGLLLHGPAGSGKTSLVEQTLARLAVPVQSVVCHERLDFQDLLVQPVYIDGLLVYVDAPLLAAYRHGQVLLLEEIDQLNPEAAIGLHRVLDGLPLSIPQSGETVWRHPDFRLLATANSALLGDATGLYQGAKRQNYALATRFELLEVGYPAEVDEQQILGLVLPQLEEGLRHAMIRVANAVRASYQARDTGEENGPAFEAPLSTRTLLHWGQLTWRYAGLRQAGLSPLHKAIDAAFGRLLEPTSQTALHELVQREVGE
ncbi:MAG: AAA family ATPase [Candidatus Competibacteraceae bacterium]